MQWCYIHRIGLQTSVPNLLMFSSAKSWWQAERATSKMTASSATHYHRPQSASAWHYCQRNGLSSRHTGASTLTASIHGYVRNACWRCWHAPICFSGKAGPEWPKKTEIETLTAPILLHRAQEAAFRTGSQESFSKTNSDKNMALTCWHSTFRPLNLQKTLP